MWKKSGVTPNMNPKIKIYFWYYDKDKCFPKTEYKINGSNFSTFYLHSRYKTP